MENSLLNFPDNVGGEYCPMIFVKDFEICCKNFFTQKRNHYLPKFF